jgi:protein TonB
MFETAALSGGPAGHRVWTTCAGMTGQLILVACMIVVPMFFPAVLPKPQAVMAWLDTPATPPPPPPVSQPVTEASAAPPPAQSSGRTILEPVRIPAEAALIVDPPPSPVPGVPGGVAYAQGNVLSDMVSGMAEPIAAAPVAAPAVERAAELAAPAAPPRVKVGGRVRPAVVIHSVEPVYPALAQQAHVSGMVELEAVIGTDGRIRDLSVKSGPPLLIRAAVEAVRQWIYAPTLLNEEPVEVIQPIIVRFNLR